MKVLLYGLNFSPELTGIGKYSGEMVEWLSQHGFEVRVIAAPPYYPEWKVRSGYSSWSYKRENIHGAEVFRVPIFVPKKPTTITRLLHLISYSISSIPVVIKQVFWKPDIVIFIQPTLFASLGALLVSKLSGAKSLMHIQDYEVDAMFGLGMMQQGLLLRTIKKIESWLMMHFDFISSISYSMIENAKQKGVKDARLLFFPNWADTDFVTPEVDGSAIRAEWGFSENDQIVLYSGNIGKKQGLELVLDAAEGLKSKASVQFLIVGTGAHADVLKNDAMDRGLTNVHFKSLQPWELVPYILAMADIHLVVQKYGAADAVLPSKLTNILSAGGHALVTAEHNTELGVLEKNFPGIYTCVEPENSKLFTEALLALLEKDLRLPNKVARNYAVEYLSAGKVLSRFEADLKKL